MSLQSRIFLVYVVIILLTGLIGFGFYKYVSTALEESLYNSLEGTVGRMAQQTDSLLRPMEYASLQLLSNNRFLSSLEDLDSIEKNSMDNMLLLNKAENEIRSLMMSYSFYKNFYRVTFFNLKANVATSDYGGEPEFQQCRKIIHELNWLSAANQRGGKIAVIPPYYDPWDTGDSPERVFGISRAVRGGDPFLGYIEVQQPYRELQEVFDNGDGSFVCAVTQEGAVFYSEAIPDELLERYYDLASQGFSGAVALQNPQTQAWEVTVHSSCDYSGISIILVQNRDILLMPVKRLGVQFIILGLVVVAVSLLYIFFQSRSITAPLLQLKREMEITRLETLPKDMHIEDTNNEVTSLSNAFFDLKERLADAIDKELRLQTLHMQASFDALQARVNPHFIYNTLNLISNKSALAGNEDVCDICDSMAAMLRYSVSTRRRQVTLREELAHLENYIYLMQNRFEHRLQFEVAVDDSILDVTVPKMILQPVVENSFNHGYEHSGGVMRIRIDGWLQGNGWHVQITDNGQGFSPEALEELQRKMLEHDNSRYEPQSTELGGMGIINIYARLQLFYPQGFTMDLGNSPYGGAWIMFGSTTDGKEQLP